MKIFLNKILIKIIYYSAFFVHFVVNGHIVSRLRKIHTMFYSSWVKYEFAECGKENSFGGFTTLRGAKYIHLGTGLYIGRDIVWELYDNYKGARFTPSMSFGDGSSFGDGGHITCINRVIIGNGVRIGRKVFITDNSHGLSVRAQLDVPPNFRPLYSKGAVVIEDNVWIGEMACILPGVTIGRGSIVGANAVVTRDIPPYSVAAGNPAHVVKSILG